MKINIVQLADDLGQKIRGADSFKIIRQLGEDRGTTGRGKAAAATLGCNFTTAVLAALILLVTTLFCAIPLAQADRGRGREVIRDNDYYGRRGYVLDRRYSHNRYYPRPGLRLERLPSGSRFLPYRNRHYYYNDGAWYLPSRRGFSVILPPVGLTVPLLPSFYTTIWVKDRPYYYADGVYYVWRPENQVYVVTEPPPATEVVEQSAIPEQIFIYPKAGQSAAQQETDRYECHRWAVDQTGFDPTQPGGNVPTEQHPGKRLEYQRAMKACLEARNYSVQ
jgi:hypothetical protein